MLPLSFLLECRAPTYPGRSDTRALSFSYGKAQGAGAPLRVKKRRRGKMVHVDRYTAPPNSMGCDHDVSTLQQHGLSVMESCENVALLEITEVPRPWFVGISQKCPATVEAK
jgi:hypothetical protein